MRKPGWPRAFRVPPEPLGHLRPERDDSPRSGRPERDVSSGFGRQEPDVGACSGRPERDDSPCTARQEPSPCPGRPERDDSPRSGRPERGSGSGRPERDYGTCFGRQERSRTPATRQVRSFLRTGSPRPCIMVHGFRAGLVRHGPRPPGSVPRDFVVPEHDPAGLMDSGTRLPDLMCSCPPVRGSGPPGRGRTARKPGQGVGIRTWGSPRSGLKGFEPLDLWTEGCQLDQAGRGLPVRAGPERQRRTEDSWRSRNRVRSLVSAAIPGHGRGLSHIVMIRVPARTLSF
jgi:hypothetical protein